MVLTLLTLLLTVMLLSDNKTYTEWIIHLRNRKLKKDFMPIL